MIAIPTSKHPLELFQSEKVRDLLVDFYVVNFVKAGIEEALPKQLVEETWKGRNNSDKETLRKHINSYFTKARRLSKNKPTEVMLFDLFDLDGVDVFADIGANKLRLVNFVAEKKPQVKKVIAIDVIPQVGEFTVPEKSEYFQISPEVSYEEFPLKAETVDFINLRYVMHHFKDIKEILKSIDIYWQTLRRNGRLLLWEETFEEEVNIDSLDNIAKSLDVALDKSLTKRFYELSTNQRFEFIIVNDWITQTGNPHMQWTYQYRQWEEWEELFKTYGFELKTKYNFGLRNAGNLKQGVHMLAEFVKS